LARPDKSNISKSPICLAIKLSFHLSKKSLFQQALFAAEIAFLSTDTGVNDGPASATMPIVSVK